VAFYRVPWLINGASHPAVLARMLTRHLARGNEGVLEGDDLKVTALTTPSGNVNVAVGECAIHQRESYPWGGTYYGYNTATIVKPIAPTAGAARSDLVVARVWDPEYPGSSLDPAVDQIIDADVISGVSSSATTVPVTSPAVSAIPLARVTLPANTSAVTEAMITDLRKVANPRRQRDYYTYYPSGTPTDDLGTTSPSWETWPLGIGRTLAVPAWATKVVVILTITGVRSNATIAGLLRLMLGASQVGQNVAYANDTSRQTMIVAGDLTLPSAMRGTSQALTPQGNRNGTGGYIYLDVNSTVAMDVEFFESPV